MESAFLQSARDAVHWLHEHTLPKVTLEGVIFTLDRRCWVIDEDDMEAVDISQKAVVLREPGLSNGLETTVAETGIQKTPKVRVTGYLCRSTVLPFFVMMGLVTELELLDGPQKGKFDLESLRLLGLQEVLDAADTSEDPDADLRRWFEQSRVW